MEILVVPCQEIQIKIDYPISRKKKRYTNLADAEPIVLMSVLSSLHAGYFRISLSLCSQALLWKTMVHLHSDLPSMAFHLLWYLALATHVSLCFLYAFKCIFFFDLVKEEFSHYIGVNYLYAPSISCLLLLQSAPLLEPHSVLYQTLFWLFAAPILTLDTKLYGQWFTTEKRFLSIMANPASQVSVIANLVAARGAAEMGWRECALCLFSLGMVHYLVIFVTLYQRLPGGNNFPTTLRPVFFLFFAAPATESLAWNYISGTFDTLAKMLFFLSLFIFVSLVCRPTLLKKSIKRFNVAWWAYSFPITFLALDSVQYAEEVKDHVASALMFIFCSISVLIFLGVMLLTAANSKRLLRRDPVLWSATGPDGPSSDTSATVSKSTYGSVDAEGPSTVSASSNSYAYGGTTAGAAADSDGSGSSGTAYGDASSRIYGTTNP
ncbi:PREDICTED: S-type anion channel SLAH4-like isoform X3 [Brassica oleracea var. oleracea]|nr:PREDICTED: S-type anion channel SLAH4-like isoform X3 [Brassica oleracea var. oleracea]